MFTGKHPFVKQLPYATTMDILDTLNNMFTGNRPLSCNNLNATKMNLETILIYISENKKAFQVLK